MELKKVSVEEYRKILNDHISSEEQIKGRLDYLEALCHNVIIIEIESMLQRVKSSGLKKYEPKG